MRLRTALVLVFVAATSRLTAQAAKKALTQADWDRWQSIQAPTLSADGKWVAYTLAPQVGDGEFVVRSTSAATEYRVPVGYISRPNNTPAGLRGAGGGGAPAAAGGGGRGGAGGAGSGGPFTADSRYALVTTQANQAEVERAQKARAGRGARGGAAGAADSASQTALVIVSLADGKTTTLENVRSFRLPRDNGTWMTYTPGPSDSTTARGDSAAGNAQGGAGGRGAGGGGRGAGRGGRGGAGGGARRGYGSTIVLRNLATGVEERLTDVLASTFDDSAKVFAYTVASRDSSKDGVFIRNLTTGAVQTVMAGPGNYRAFAFDRKQQQFIFASDRDEWGKPEARSALYYGTLKDGLAQQVVTTALLPPNMHLSDNGAAFTRSGNALLLNIAPPPEDTVPADSLVGKAVYDLWNYQDPTLQPQQKLQLGRDRNRTYQAIYTLASKKLVQITSDSMPSVSLSDDATHGMASTSLAYQISDMWGDTGDDIYVVDPVTGNHKLIRKKISGSAQLSVDGKYIAFFDEGHWYSYAIATARTTDLTGGVKGVAFDQSETWSTPDTPAAWGIAGWTKGDHSLLVYDRFDIWELDPAGMRAPVMVTDSLGRREHLTLRIIAGLDRDPDERAIDPAKPLMLSAFNVDTKASGFYRDRLDAKQAPEKIVMADLKYGVPQKARNADEYLVTKATFTDFPNLWVGPSLTALTKVTSANPWQSDYRWGTAELVHWTSEDGVPLEGILYKPENFDPSKKYPMVSYFYEEQSDGLYNYIAPNGRNTINPTHYVSNGYLIFEPDIHYEIGYPGPSAVKSIVPGVEMLLARGYVDPKGLGLQGQSWGGYEATFIITQTTMFSAVMAGGVVGNMTSAYGGIRWGSGLARAFQYEKTQSRIGKSLWDAQNLYIANSPLFWLDRVKTPLFLMSNDADEDVPWWQGIELFVGMRRLGKEVYMIDYNNDSHNPSSRANQKDIAMRMEQFFDNKLKGAPAPDWMTHGIPAKDKGKDQITAAPALKPVVAAPPGGGTRR
ncbi:MAG TPA: prolyl oligopeptidase family serine peptidase [Gemmatimonadales bacterium]|nr:prolyl oligopeptidase family serine peptidase [Gemmatimonadales bacterium]